MGTFKHDKVSRKQASETIDTFMFTLSDLSEDPRFTLSCENHLHSP